MEILRMYIVLKPRQRRKYTYKTRVANSCKLVAKRRHGFGVDQVEDREGEGQLYGRVRYKNAMEFFVIFLTAI